MKLKTLNLLFMSVLLLLVVLMAFITYDPHLETNNPVLQFFVDKHLLLMLLMAIVATVFGFFFSKTLTTEITSRESTNQAIFSLLITQLGKHEKDIVRHLLNGPTTQAKLSELPSISRVNAHRAVARLQERGLIKVLSRGKTKQIELVPALSPKP